MARTIPAIFHDMTDIEIVGTPGSAQSWLSAMIASIGSVDRGWQVDQSNSTHMYLEPTGTLANNTPNARILVMAHDGDTPDPGVIDDGVDNLLVALNNGSVFVGYSPDAGLGTLPADPYAETTKSGLWGGERGTGVSMCMFHALTFDAVRFIAGDERAMLLARQNASNIWCLQFDAGAIYAPGDDASGEAANNRIFGYMANGSQGDSAIQADQWSQATQSIYRKYAYRSTTGTPSTEFVNMVYLDPSDGTTLRGAYGNHSIIEDSAFLDGAGFHNHDRIPVSRRAGTFERVGWVRQIGVNGAENCFAQYSISGAVKTTALSNTPASANQAIWVDNFI